MLCFTDVTKAETKAKIIKYPKIRRGNQLFQNASRNKGESGKTGKKFQDLTEKTRARVDR